jgi:hypothetical protein
VYANPRAGSDTLRQQARVSAERAVQIDWKAERARVEDKVLRERFPGQRRGALTPEVQAEVDAIVDPELAALRETIFAQQVPAIIERRERWITTAELVPAALVMLALDPKSIDLSARVPVELEPAQP